MRMAEANLLLNRVEQIIVCPVCKRHLIKRDHQRYYCSHCNNDYPLENNVLTLVSPNLHHCKRMEAEYHNGVADNYATMHQSNTLKVGYYTDESLAPILALPNKSLILEVGCGTGDSGTKLLQRHYVVETDISYGMLLKASQNQRHPGAMYVLADAEAIPFESNSFDAVYIDATLHHLTNPSDCVTEIARVVKAGGLIIIGGEPNKWALPLIHFGKKLLRRQSSIMDAKTSGFNYREIRGLLDKPELSIVRIKPVWYINGFLFTLEGLLRKNILPPFIEKFFIWLDELIGKIPVVNRYGWYWNAILLKKDIYPFGQLQNQSL